MKLIRMDKPQRVNEFLSHQAYENFHILTLYIYLNYHETDMTIFCQR